jgi:membrane-associated phospholipid phosphatase
VAGLSAAEPDLFTDLSSARLSKAAVPTSSLCKPEDPPIDLSNAFFGSSQSRALLNVDYLKPDPHLNEPLLVNPYDVKYHEPEATDVNNYFFSYPALEPVSLSDILDHQADHNLADHDSRDKLSRFIITDWLQACPLEFDVSTTALAAGILGASFMLDGAVVSESNSLTHFGNMLGDKEGVLALLVAPMLAGKMIGDEKLIDAALIASESAVYTGLVTQLVKELSGRERPDGSDDMSFFSGHASFVASIAGSYSETYNWDPKVAIPLHVFAAMTAYARVATDNHHESDVIWGLVVGELIGIANAKFRKDFSTPFSLEPYTDGTAFGAVITYRF